MAESKFVIRINYDKQSSSTSKPKIVTIWHIKRILAALVILILLIITLTYWLSSSDNLNTSKTEHTEHPELQTMPDGLTQQHQQNDLAQPKIIDQEALKSKTLQKRNQPASTEIKRSQAIIFNGKVIRASLNTELKDYEPYHTIKWPISLSENQTLELFISMS